MLCFWDQWVAFQIYLRPVFVVVAGGGATGVKYQGKTLGARTCVFDHSLEKVFFTKVLEYQQMQLTIFQPGYRCKNLISRFGGLGHVHELVVRGLQMADISK